MTNKECIEMLLARNQLELISSGLDTQKHATCLEIQKCLEDIKSKLECI